MRTLSTGQPSTLGSYYDNCKAFFGPESRSARYFETMIATHLKGREEEVEADETQMMALVCELEGKS